MKFDTRKHITINLTWKTVNDMNIKPLFQIPGFQFHFCHYASWDLKLTEP